MISLLLLLASICIAQKRVDPRLMYDRVIAVGVALQGSGSHADPIRPLFIPATRDPFKRDGIISFSFQLSDDGKSAIVEYVAIDRKALKPILEDSRLAGKVFERGVAKKEDIEREAKKIKSSFRLEETGVGR